MGLRGPLRDPNSVRGRREQRKAAKLSVIDGSSVPSDTVAPLSPDLPQCPRWLSVMARGIYNGLVNDLVSAKVPIKSVDTHAIAMAAQCLEALQEAEDLSRDKTLETDHRIAALKLKAQYQRDLKDWLQIICATPGARARMGMRPAPEKKGGKLAELLAARMVRNGC